MAPITTDSNSNLEWYDMKYNGLMLSYTLSYWGVQPEEGYPLIIGLHGGSGAAVGDTKSTDEIWYSFAKNYYVSAIKPRTGANFEKSGIAYVALRGITTPTDDGKWQDGLGMHFTPEGQIMIQALIKNLLEKQPVELAANFKDHQGKLNDTARYFVDSNSVHLLGFGLAGGAGAFQLGSNLPDLFANVVCAQGPPWGLNASEDSLMASLANFANLPVWFQIGEKGDHKQHEDEFGRFAGALNYARYYLHLNKKQEEWGTNHYEHWISIVKGGTSTSWFDWKDPYALHETLNNIDLWFNKPQDPHARDSKPTTLDPVGWSLTTKRNPTPDAVVWHMAHRLPVPKTLQSGTKWEQKRFYYWLFDRKPSVSKDSDETVSASIKTNNASGGDGKTTITISTPSEFLGILLTQKMANLKDTITVTKKDGTWTEHINVGDIQPKVKQELIVAREDNFLFDVLLYFYKDPGNNWKIKSAASLIDDGGEPLIGDLVV